MAIVAARDEEESIGQALDSLAAAFPGWTVFVADDASTDGTARLARERGARVVSGARSRGKGANVTSAARSALEWLGSSPVTGRAPADKTVLLCDADLASSAGRLAPLVEAVESDECELAIAAFTRRIGGGLGIAVGFSQWVVRRLCGLRLAAPLSGQRAVRADVLESLLPLAHGFGLETGMDVDAGRAGYRIREIELPLEHRATGRTPGGFVHRGRQLTDVVRVYASRRRRHR